MSKRANGRTSDPALTSQFMALVNQSARHTIRGGGGRKCEKKEREKKRKKGGEMEKRRKKVGVGRRGSQEG